jgi:hypothetical protein
LPAAGDGVAADRRESISVQISVASARRSSSPLVSAIFTMIGLGLLGGAATAYYYFVQRPLTWPTTDAVVVSSRVVNPKGPSDHQPEIVFRLTSDGRDVRTIANWSSGSYDMVRSYVDRYPAGATVTVAVNPDDPADVRYDLGASFANLIVPGVIGAMGVLFTAIGLFTLLGRTPPAGPAASRGAPSWVSTLFTAIGLVIGGIGVWLLSGDTALSWPTVDAGVVESRIITTSSSSSNAESRLASYAAGSRHLIRYRPDDPNVIRFEVTPFKVYALPGGMLAMSAIFLFFGVLSRRFLTPRT